jgi:protein-tyrosine phosphatase
MSLDADRIGPGFYQGGVPRSAKAVMRAGFDTLVLCAQEVQPPPHALSGLHVIRCPLNDDPTVPVPREAQRLAIQAAKKTVDRLRSGHRVLVTCMQGINRSGLISALTLHLMTGRPGADCAQHVQRCRPGALSNPRFVEWLSTL